MNLRLIFLFALAAGAGRAPAAEPPAAPATKPVAAPAVPNAAGTLAPRSANPVPATATAPRSESAVAPATSFEAFRLITERNIFNPNRTGRRDRSNDAAPPRLDVITLVGTMDSDKGLRAFFDGSTAGFRKALHVGESVDKFNVTKIAPNLVNLERDGKTLSLRVGQQLQRAEGADWNLIGDAPAVLAEPARADPNAPPVIPANADDVTRRMMERRAKALRN